MNKPTKIFIAAAVTGSLLIGGGWLRTRNLEHRELVLVTTCKAEDAKAKAAADPYAKMGTLVCDPDDLESLEQTAGIQAEMVEAHRAAKASRLAMLVPALVLLCIGAVPWLWYFLLRRVAELRSAVSGKPPM